MEHTRLLGFQDWSRVETEICLTLERVPGHLGFGVNEEVKFGSALRLALDISDLWNRNDFLTERQLRDLGCLRHDVHQWRLHDQHNKDIDDIISALQLVNLCGLLNIAVHMDLSLHYNKGFTDFC